MPERLFALPDVKHEGTPVKQISPSAWGRIAELRAEAKLLELGLRVARPCVDDHGVDLLVNGCGVQVKSTRTYQDDRRWRFEFRTARKDGLRDATNVDRTRISDDADVFLLYAHGAGIWWVVPRSALAGGSRQTVTPGERFDRSWREAWWVFGENA